MQNIKRNTDSRGTVYYINNKKLLHCEEGPAVIYKDGIEEWWLNGIEYIPNKNMPLNLYIAYCKREYEKTYES